MPLTDTSVRNAKPAEKTRRLFDAGSLYLEVSPKGGKWWRFKYRFGGKEKRLSLGTYPDVSLKKARDRRDDARKLVSNGVDPSEHRKITKATMAEQAANSFEAVALEWFAKYSPNWKESHSKKVIGRLEKNVLPWLGNKPISSISAPELLEVVRRIEKRGALETAYRVLRICGQVFRYAVASGLADRDPSGVLRGALPPVQTKHLAAVTEPAKVGELLRAIDGYQGTFVVHCAMRFAPLVFLRPGELRQAEWKDFDFDAAEWRFIPSKTKKQIESISRQLIVPLSHQAIDILRELHPLTGSGRYVFPSARSPSGNRPMSDNAILSALRSMGVGKEEMCSHGFRAMARTILDEVLGFRPDFIEHQLAHAVRDPNGRAYNRTAHLPERRKMMQDWANYLDKLKANVDDISTNQTA